MKFNGPESFAGNSSEGRQASEALRVFKVMEQRAAIARLRQEQLEAPVLEGSDSLDEGEAIATEYGTVSPAGIREALDTVFPERKNLEDETLH